MVFAIAPLFSIVGLEVGEVLGLAGVADVVERGEVEDLSDGPAAPFRYAALRVDGGSGLPYRRVEPAPGDELLLVVEPRYVAEVDRESGREVSGESEPAVHPEQGRALGLRLRLQEAFEQGDAL